MIREDLRESVHDTIIPSVRLSFDADQILVQGRTPGDQRAARRFRSAPALLHAGGRPSGLRAARVH